MTYAMSLAEHNAKYKAEMRAIEENRIAMWRAFAEQMRRGPAPDEEYGRIRRLPDYEAEAYIDYVKEKEANDISV